MPLSSTAVGCEVFLCKPCRNTNLLEIPGRPLKIIFTYADNRLKDAEALIAAPPGFDPVPALLPGDTRELRYPRLLEPCLGTLAETPGDPL